MDTRRRRSAAEREQIVEETKTASVSSVARKHGIAKSLLFRWRKDAGLAGKLDGKASATRRFLPVRLAPGTGSATVSAASTSSVQSIEIVLANGRLLRIDPLIEAAVLTRIVTALEAK
jgi:transposase